MTLVSPSLRDGLPAGPNLSPTLQLVNWIVRPFPFLDGCAQQYGDVFTVQFNSFCPMVFCSHPEGIQDIFKASPEHVASGQVNGLLRPLVGNESILLLDGDRHQRQRQLLMPPFHGERMRAYGTLICDITRQVSASWVDGASFSVRPAMQDISLKVILRAVFGITDEEDHTEDLRELVSGLLDMTGSPLSSSLLFIRSLQKDWGAWSPWGRFLQKKSQVDAILYGEIHRRRNAPNPDGKDILSLLLAAQDESGNSMTDVELRDELMTLLLAGHETTASALSWALYWIHQLPSVYEALSTELMGVDLTDEMAIARLPYLNAVCQETLRIYPIAPIAFPRLVIDHPYTMMGYRIPPGTMMVPCIYLTHRRPDTYPDSHQFRPERFLDHSFSSYEFLPFGGGNRRCVGMAFALFEMKLVLATLITRFKLKVVGDRHPKPTRRGVTIAPPRSLKIRAVKYSVPK